jgi:hypothetical protein
MFEYYNLLDPIEWGAEIFEVNFQQGNFKILWLLVIVQLDVVHN